MNRILLALFLLLVTLGSCSKEAPKPLSKEEMQECIDSLTCARIKEVDELARIDMEYRMKIEMKVRVDSMVQAILQQKTDTTLPADTTHNPQP